MTRAGIFILAMAVIGFGLNWRDWNGGNIETQVADTDYRRMQLVLAAFGIVGLGLVIYDRFRKR